MKLTPADGKRKPVRPKKTWRRTFHEDLSHAHITWEEAETVKLAYDQSRL